VGLSLVSLVHDVNTLAPQIRAAAIAQFINFFIINIVLLGYHFACKGNINRGKRQKNPRKNANNIMFSLSLHSCVAYRLCPVAIITISKE
jgi:uncharacterized membrane protein